MKKKYLDEIKAVVIFAFGIFSLISLLSYDRLDLPFYTNPVNNPIHNLCGVFGAWLAGILFLLFGWTGYIVPAVIFIWAIKKFRGAESNLYGLRILGLIGVFFCLSAILSITGPGMNELRFARGGYVGYLIGNFMLSYFKITGSYVILATLGLLFFVLFAEFLVSNLFANSLRFFQSLPLKFPPGPKMIKVKSAPVVRDSSLEKKPLEPKINLNQSKITENIEKKSEPEIKLKISTPKVEPAKVKFPPVISVGDYKLPTLDLLDSPPPLSSRQIKEDLAGNARILEETLADFGIEVKVTNIERGPVITRYELEPAPGVKVQKITSLSDDIALAMKAQSVRIVAPIPGKARVGVEVPNGQSAVVYFKEVLSTQEFFAKDAKLTLALGKDITGAPVISALEDLPHLLIAGTTGSGKTVCVNSLIISLLYRLSPNELKFIMIDPKMVELMPFNGLAHLLCPVITDHKKVSTALNWLVSEMENRYQLLAKAGARNIKAYNEKGEILPYIVVIIDELADLMVVAANQIETAITRLAQLSRAVGIHLILATQRPSVDVITGVIKANFPARVSFKVASKVDSRTVLDANGADKLLGRGDLLFLKPGETKLIRAQGSYLQDKEIDRVVEFIKAQVKPVYEEDMFDSATSPFSVANQEKDELFDEAVRMIMESNQASVSILQRRLRLGYTRAARLIDSMEEAGLVGPYEGSKPRKILADREEWLAKYTQNNQVKEGSV